MRQIEEIIDKDVAVQFKDKEEQKLFLQKIEDTTNIKWSTRQRPTEWMPPISFLIVIDSDGLSINRANWFLSRNYKILPASDFLEEMEQDTTTDNTPIDHIIAEKSCIRVNSQEELDALQTDKDFWVFDYRWKFYYPHNNDLDFSSGEAKVYDFCQVDLKKSDSIEDFTAVSGQSNSACQPFSRDSVKDCNKLEFPSEYVNFKDEYPSPHIVRKKERKSKLISINQK